MTREDEAGMDAIMKAFCMYHEADCTVSFIEFTYLVNNCSSYIKYRYASLYGPLSYYLFLASNLAAMDILSASYRYNLHAQ